ncbi:hypothetical protein [Silvimonas amylolytica]|uniref:Uncharacterized protein n=1 Tax=Silvimonas amylolytica TaxID=449663 RepID=A0ABQ2PII8_9NEIS|nr:hypothetical protein [Silvimonas amylolytica]GGP25089.1 hypothetical protein GCM10010971_09080 [Silvimonas amylolytica]
MTNAYKMMIPALALLALSAHASATQTGGTITFTGAIVEDTCQVQVSTLSMQTHLSGCDAKVANHAQTHIDAVKTKTTVEPVQSTAPANKQEKLAIVTTEYL